MEVLAINQRNLDRMTRQCPRGQKPAKTGSNDHHTWIGFLVHSPTLLDSSCLSGLEKLCRTSGLEKSAAIAAAVCALNENSSQFSPDPLAIKA